MAPITLTKSLEKKTRIFALAGDPGRIRILQLLNKRKKVNVTDIAAEISMNVPCVSHHLQLLKDNGIVEAKRAGNNIYYQLAKNKLIKNIIALTK